MDLLTGGDLRYHMSRKRLFTEEQTSKNIWKITIVRIFYWMHFTWIGIPTYEWNTSSRHKTLKSSF